MKRTSIFINGKIYSMDADNTCYSAMAVKDGRIFAVGNGAEEFSSEFPDAEIVDLQGKTVLPGLCDGHSHVFLTGSPLLELSLSGMTKEEIIEAVRKKAGEVEPGEWIVGMGWNQDEWEDRSFPVKEELDAVAPNNPVKLSRYCGNAYWCNSMAIDLAMGADDDKENKNSGSEFMVDKNGKPAGTLVGPACSRIDAVIPRYTKEQYKKMFLNLDKYNLAFGYTSLMEKGAGAQSPLSVDGSQPVVELLHDLYRDKEMKIRSHVAIIGLDPFADEYFKPGWEAFEYGDMLSVRSVKLWTDGALGPHTAYLSEDYKDRPGHRGNRKFTDEELTALFKKYDDLGVQIEVHTIGDGTTRQIIDCFENAFEGNYDKDRRFIMDHVHLPEKSDIEKMAKYNIINSTQYIQFASDMGFMPKFLSDKLIERSYPWRDILDAGCMIVNGSDMDPFNPFLFLYVAVTRKNEKGENTLEKEPLKTLTRLEAMRSMTTASAYALFMEDRLGSLEAGKYADFIVIDRDYFECPEEEIKEITVDETFINGESVYKK